MYPVLQISVSFFFALFGGHAMALLFHFINEIFLVVINSTITPHQRNSDVRREREQKTFSSSVSAHSCALMTTSFHFAHPKRQPS